MCTHVCVIYIYGYYSKISTYYPCQGVRCFFSVSNSLFLSWYTFILSYTHSLFKLLWLSPKYPLWLVCSNLVPTQDHPLNLDVESLSLRPSSLFVFVVSTFWAGHASFFARCPLLGFVRFSLMVLFNLVSPPLYFLITTGSAIGLMNTFYIFFKLEIIVGDFVDLILHWDT